jgi:hypothetical protein
VGNLRSVVVHAGDDVAAFGKARSCDESLVSGSDYTDLHGLPETAGKVRRCLRTVSRRRGAYGTMASEGGTVMAGTALDLAQGRGQRQTR